MLTLDKPPTFDATLRAGLLDLLAWRRDVRAFKIDPLPHGTVERLIKAACLAPSVGLSEPWRFVVVEDADLRRAVRANFETCNAAALALQDESRQALYARLKLSGLDRAPVHIAAFADGTCEQGHGLGRLTMPKALDYSVAIAIHTLWLAARLEGIGLGWVSIVDPEAMTAILDVPASWRFIGYLCVGYPAKNTTFRPCSARDGTSDARPHAASCIAKPMALDPENVWDYPRPPRLEPVPQRLRIVFGGETIADTIAALRVLETTHPPVYYLPQACFTCEIVVSERQSFCEWKGMARYLTLRVAGRKAVDCAWTYPRPDPSFVAIRDHIAVYPAAMDACFVGDEQVRPQPGGFYGGWVTTNLVGPFKGAPGTMGW